MHKKTAETVNKVLDDTTQIKDGGARLLNLVQTLFDDGEKTRTLLLGKSGIGSENALRITRLIYQSRNRKASLSNPGARSDDQTVNTFAPAWSS